MGFHTQFTQKKLLKFNADCCTYWFTYLLYLLTKSLCNLEWDRVIDRICPQLSSDKICETQLTLITFIRRWQKSNKKGSKWEASGKFSSCQKKNTTKPSEKVKVWNLLSSMPAVDTTLLILPDQVKNKALGYIL